MTAWSDKKKIIKSSICFILLIVAVLATLVRLDFVFRRKDIGSVQENFARLQEETLDIVFIGNSHQFCTVSSELLYAEYGLNTFMLATSAQTIPMSYYGVMEAIELKHPKKIVLETFYVPREEKISSREFAHVFLDGMPYCDAKLEAIEDLIEREERVYYYLPLGFYHSRWKELNEKDYGISYVSSRGDVNYKKANPNGDIPLVSPKEKAAIPHETLLYLDLIVDLCEKNGVELVMYTAPYNAEYEDEESYTKLADEQRVYNSLADYAAERNIEYCNLFYELDKIGIDMDTDWFDRQHLNTKGKKKVTRYLADNGYFRVE